MSPLGSSAESGPSSADLTAARRELDERLADLGKPLALAGAELLPILDGPRVAGLVAHFTEARAASPFVREPFRGRGIGDDVVERLIEQGTDLLILEGSGSRRYFEERGYRPWEELAGVVRLRAPTVLPNVRAAASICLLEPSSGSVLLGQRLTPPWLGYWAFPGGKLEPGEPALEGALRELHEETGILVRERDVVLRTRVYAGGIDTVYAVDNFCIVVRAQQAPESLPEIAARWVTLTEARQLRPMAAGTRRVVRRILARFSNAFDQ